MERYVRFVNVIKRIVTFLPIDYMRRDNRGNPSGKITASKD